MGAHSHGAHGGHGHDVSVASAPLPRLILLLILGAALAATVAGVVALWPQGSRPTAQYAAEGVTFPRAEVISMGAPCPVAGPQRTEPMPEGCDRLEVELADGERQTIGVPPGVASSHLRAGDEVELMRIPGAPGADPVYAWSGVVRGHSLALMTGLFVASVLLVARLRGLLALAGLVFAGAVLWWFVLPALLTGESGPAVALVGSSAIMFVVLYLAHGLSIRTSTALAGTLAGVAVTAGLGWWAVGSARLSGVADDAGEILRSQAPDLDFRGLLMCSVIIAGLGVLNDVTITQSSAVWELRAANPGLSRAQLFASGMRIGRDHIASTIYTIVFAYAGTALVVLLLVSLYDRALLTRLVDEGFGEEIVRTLASAIGLVLAVPATTAIAALTVRGPEHRH